MRGKCVYFLNNFKLGNINDLVIVYNWYDDNNSGNSTLAVTFIFHFILASSYLLFYAWQVSTVVRHNNSTYRDSIIQMNSCRQLSLHFVSNAGKNTLVVKWQDINLRNLNLSVLYLRINVTIKLLCGL